MIKTKDHTVVTNYIQAYTKLHGKKPYVSYSHGWFKVGFANVRISQLPEITNELNRQIRIKETEAP